MSSLAAEPQRPLWLSAGGQQPPRLYLFWQSGWDPVRRPAHVPLVRDVRPDLFQYARLPDLSTGVPHESLCPAPGDRRVRWWYEKKGEPAVPAAGVQPQWWTTEQYAQRVAEAAQGARFVTEATGAYGLAPYVWAAKIEGEPHKRLRF